MKGTGGSVVCGIIGIVSNRPVAEEIYTGLFTLQHRGQDAAGVTTFDGELHAVKDVGLVRDVFRKEDAEKLAGKIGIGHVRYPTAGSTLKTDAQPFFTPYPCLIAMCHNGNLANHQQARKTVEERYKGTLTSHSDIEVILQIFAHELAKQETYNPENVFEAIEKTMTLLNGSYSVVGFTPKGLFAFRDPNGIRPLVFGKSYDEDAYAFASETVALDVMNYKVERDVKPGECVFVTNDLQVFSKQVAQAKPAHCMFEWVYFARADSVIEKRSVYETRLELGKSLARAFMNDNAAAKISADVVIPMPDTARPAAAAFSDETRIPNREGLIKNRYADRTFIMPFQTLREKEMTVKLNPLIHEVRGKSVALVDDSLVRGTASGRIIKALKKAGASQVHVFLTCPPLKHPCPYGIDMATRGELAAGARTTEQIRKEIGADSLHYQTIDALRQAIGLPLCTACLDGRYPTGLTQEQLAHAEAGRTHERKVLC